jgi:hypothetical protein
LKEKEGGGLFEGIWPKRMCREKKREAKDYVGGIRWGSVEALSLGFRWAVAPLDLRNVFVLGYLLLQIVKLTVELPFLVKWRNSSAFKLWKTCQVEGKVNHQIEMRSTVPVLSKSFQLDATRLSFSIFFFCNLS